MLKSWHCSDCHKLAPSNNDVTWQTYFVTTILYDNNVHVKVLRQKITTFTSLRLSTPADYWGEASFSSGCHTVLPIDVPRVHCMVTHAPHWWSNKHLLILAWPVNSLQFVSTVRTDHWVTDTHRLTAPCNTISHTTCMSTVYYYSVQIPCPLASPQTRAVSVYPTTIEYVLQNMYCSITILHKLPVQYLIALLV